MPLFNSPTAQRWHENWIYFFDVMRKFAADCPADVYRKSIGDDQPTVEDLLRRIGQAITHDARVTVELSPQMFGSDSDSDDSAKDSVLNQLNRAGKSLTATLRNLDEQKASRERKTMIAMRMGTVAEELTSLIARTQYFFGQAYLTARANGFDFRGEQYPPRV